MLEISQITVAGHVFQIVPMDPFEQRRLDARIMKILAPILASLVGAAKSQDKPEAPVEGVIQEPSSDDLEIDGEVVGKALAAALSDLSSTDSETMFRDLFKGLTWLGEDGGPDVAPVPMTSSDKISKVFRAMGVGPTIFYKLAFEVARFNKFTPFEFAEGGVKIPGMSGLPALAKKAGLDLGRLER